MGAYHRGRASEVVHAQVDICRPNQPYCALMICSVPVDFEMRDMPVAGTQRSQRAGKVGPSGCSVPGLRAGRDSARQQRGAEPRRSQLPAGIDERYPQGSKVSLT